MEFNPTPRQDIAYEHLTDDCTRYILYGGAKGGGKSYLLCVWALIWCKMLCDKFGLKPSDHPVALGFLGRKQSVDFRKTTLETWTRVIPPSVYEIRRQDGEIVLFNSACKIFFGGLDSRETINKFNSAEFAFFAIDQAEETTREDVSVLRGAMRLTYNGVKPVYKELYTANPGECWLKEDFIDKRSPGYKYIPALPSDNPYLPEDYIKTIEEAFRYSPALLRAYRDGDWTSIKSSNILISSYDLSSLDGLNIIPQEEKRVVVCDPATSHDECVIYYMHDYAIEDAAVLIGEYDTMKIAGAIAVMARKHNTRNVGGDCIGIGKGIFDRLAELGDFDITYINSSEKASTEQFENVRAEVYWNLMQAVLDKRIKYPKDEELRRQLINVLYEVTNSSGRIKIVDKDKIKKILGNSPDRADCFAYGVWISDRVSKHIEHELSMSEDSQGRGTPMYEYESEVVTSGY